jgi:fatty acid-binding protein DegV
MSAKFILMSDSPCDFSIEDSERLQVETIPFSYQEAGKPDGGFHGLDDQFRSRSVHEFYEAIRAGAAPMTAQPSTMAFQDAFRKVVAADMPLLLFCICTGLSGGYNGAVTALNLLKEELGVDELPIYIVDSAVTSSAQYLLVEEAARRRDAGASVQEVYEWALEARYHTAGKFTSKLHQKPVDFGLFDLVVRRHLAHVHHLGLRIAHAKNCRRNQAVIDHHVGLFQNFLATERQ